MLAALSTLVGSAVLAGGQPVLGGYDVVEFFSLPADGNGVKGSKEFNATLQTKVSSKGAAATSDYTFYFKDAANLKLFNADPWKYAPQYGGYCAIGIGREVWWSATNLGPPGDPVDGWFIYDDKLYVTLGLNLVDEFEDDTETNMAMADANWIGWFGSLQAGPFNNNAVAGSDGTRPGDAPEPKDDDSNDGKQVISS